MIVDNHSSHLLRDQTNGSKETATATYTQAGDDTRQYADTHESTGAPTGSYMSVALAIVINLAMFAVLTAAVFVPIRFHTSATHHGALSTADRTIYVLLLTIVGTLCRSFTLSQVRQLWLRTFDLQLNGGKSLSQINSQWRTALGIGTLRESLKQWRIDFSFLISVLTVTAFVTGLNYNQDEETVPFSYYLPQDSSSYCMGVGASNLNGRTAPMAWHLSNGSDYEVFPFMDFCPTAQTMLLMGTINTNDPYNYGYGDLGVAVRSGAQGAPGSFYAPSFPIPASDPQTGLNDLVDEYGASLVSVHGCSPVLSHNPFACQKIDASFVQSTGNLSIASKDNSCFASNTVQSDSGYAWKICLQGNIGEATLVVAHIGTDAIYASEAMGDHAQRQAWVAAGYPSGQNGQFMLYGIQCDIRVSIQLRDLTLTMADNAHTTGAFTRTLSAGEECSISADFGWNQLKATVVGGIFQPLYVGTTGWISNLRMVLINSSITNDYMRSGPYSFDDSRSALEDVLGLTAALALSRLTLTGVAPSVEVDGSAIALQNRVGPGKLWALVFVLPSLVNVVLLAFLWWKCRSRAPAGFSRVTSSLSSLEKFVHGSR